MAEIEIREMVKRFETLVSSSRNQKIFHMGTCKG